LILKNSIKFSNASQRTFIINFRFLFIKLMCIFTLYLINLNKYKMKRVLFLIFVITNNNIYGQDSGQLIDSIIVSNNTSIYSPVNQINGYQRILNNLSAIPQGVTIGGYGEVSYNKTNDLNAEIDVQRLVMLFGYKFDERVQFVTEIEFEHVKEVYIEQAFINYSISPKLNLRAGLMLVPMGIVNEFHEPTTFNGVERPSIDNKIIPTTWREIGIGASGRIDNIGVKYQAYLFNGFLSHDGNSGKLKGSNALRGGRQKGAESTMSNLSVAGKLDFYGINGLRLGISGYNGKTSAVDGQNKIPGSEIGVSMVGIDGRYIYKKFSTRGQYTFASLSDTDLYNDLTGKDLGSEIYGYYIETAYNLLPIKKKQRLIVFARYENFDTHHAVESNISKNYEYHRKELTYGFSYHISPGSVFKIDYQNKSTNAPNSSKGQFNMGIGVWF